MTLLLVAAAGALGAPARLLVERLVTRRAGHRFPWGTLVVNVLGALAAGLVTGGSGLHGTARTAVLVGLLGAFTTFSTFTNETIRLAESAVPRRAAWYVLLTLAGALTGAAVGVAVAP